MFNLSAKGLYNQLTFKVDTQDYCEQFSIQPNVKYGDNLAFFYRDIRHFCDMCHN